MPIKKNMRLGDLLVESGLISQEQLNLALAEKDPNQKLGDVLVQKGYVTELQLVEVLEFQLGIPRVTLFNYPFDTSLLKLVSKDFARRHLVIPLKKEKNKLFVAMADPMDYFVLNDLRLSTGFAIEPMIAMKDDITRSISRLYDVDDIGGEFTSLEAEQEIDEITSDDDEDSPVVKLVNQILQQAAVQQASDIHFDCTETKIMVRYRIDGKLRNVKSLPKNIQGPLITRIKIMANLDITEHRIPQDGRIKLSLEHRQMDLKDQHPTDYLRGKSGD